MWNEIIPDNVRGRLAGIEMISCLSGLSWSDARARFVAAIFGVTF